MAVRIDIHRATPRGTGAGHGDDLSGRQVDPAQQVVDRVRDHQVVAGLLSNRVAAAGTAPRLG